MSTPDANEENEVGENASVKSDVNDHAAQNPNSESANGLPILFFIVGLAVSFIIGWIVFPGLLYSKKKQPIDFNHVLHNEMVDNGCESCHFFRNDGSFAGVPTLAQCVDCHTDIQGDSKDETIFVEKYVSKNIEVPWHVYSRQPDCVFFSHAAHVKLAKMECETCHGPIGESTSLKIYEQNRISGYSRDIWGKNFLNMLTLKKDTWERMKMDDCAECHIKETGRDTSVQTKKDGCFVCHK